MITVRVKCDCFDIPGVTNLSLELEDNATVGDMLLKFVKHNGVDVPYAELSNYTRLFIIDSQVVKIDARLKNGDEVWILFAMAGG